MDRMSNNELKIALLENRQQPDPACLESIESEVTKHKLPKCVTGLLVTLLLGGFAFSVLIFVWHREDVKSIRNKIESADKAE